MGSVRASNFFVAVLSSIGLAGTVLYAGFLYTFAHSRYRGLADESAAVAQGCRAACLILVLKALLTKSTPDLEVPFFLYAGVAIAYASLVAKRVDASNPGILAASTWQPGARSPNRRHRFRR